MSDISRKLEYVRNQTQTRNHKCHWPGCGLQVSPALWGCKKHWFALPQVIRDEIWDTYVPGQEKWVEGEGPRPTDAYIAAADRAQAWIKTQAWIKENQQRG